MKFRIDARIFDTFGGLHVGVVIAKGIDNSGTAKEIQDTMRTQEERVREAHQLETLSQQPRIDSWRKAYAAFGAKPKEHRSSVESLYRAVLKGAELRHINTLVDIYNIISLKHMLPAGGEDLDKMTGNLVLAYAGAHEAAVVLLGDKDPRPPHEGEIIYKDDVSAVCRRWNWREADRTKLTEETRDCILVIEGIPPATREEVEQAAQELKELVRTMCGGDVRHAVLDRSSPEIEF